MQLSERPGPHEGVVTLALESLRNPVGGFRRRVGADHDFKEPGGISLEYEGGEILLLQAVRQCDRIIPTRHRARLHNETGRTLGYGWG